MRLWTLVALALVVVHATATWLTFPPFDVDWLAWVAAAPYMIFVMIAGTRRGFFWLAWLGGWLFFCLGFSWVGCVSWLVVVLLGAYQGVFPLAFALLQRRLAAAPDWRFFVTAPVLWTGAEHLRGIAFGGFPWLHPGHTQHAHLPLVQIVEITGVAGLNLLVYAVNALLAWLVVGGLRRGFGAVLRSPAFLLSAGVTLAALAATWSFGARVLAAADPRPGPAVAVVQGNIPQTVKETGQSREEILAIHRTLSYSIAEPYDLLVWPETMYPYALGRYPENAAEAQLLARALRKPFLVGALTLENDAAGVEREYNSAYMISPMGNLVQRYDKFHRVPVGEFIPLREHCAWLDALVLKASELTVIPNLSPGRSLRTFELAGRPFGALICGEVMFTYLSRSHAAAGATFLVALANDGWFLDSGELDQILHLSVFRCAELKMGMVRATNTGISGFIGPRGEIEPLVAADGKTREFPGTMVRRVLLRERETFFARHGDWLGESCLAAAAGFALLLLLRPRPRAPSQAPPAPPVAPGPPSA
ncbi:MAG: apolipoprotein N-acyltransferase [Planctomycetes bacterium]|nr:apolipoprotein N-acyltransferase [Planctomycetota bacterium]